MALAPRPRRRVSRLTALAASYVGGLLFIAAVFAVASLALNIVVDPLWYFRGNQVNGVNYAFNERLAKMARFLPRMEEYDCLVLGSSHTALLPVSEIPGRRCFNMAFSHGRVSEYIKYAEYLRDKGFRPTEIIINVDKYDFEEDAPPNIPEFVREGKNPPSFLLSYLSIDSLGFSLRTLRQGFPNRLYYDRSFNMHIIPRSRYRGPLALPTSKPFFPERTDEYIELRDIFPQARAIGFAPPISGWYIGRLKADGKLDAYLDALETISEHFDVFLDFSVPSVTTMSVTNSYDGDHYLDPVNEATVAAIAAEHAPSGADWHREPSDVIRARYEQRLKELVFRQQEPEPEPDS